MRTTRRKSPQVSNQSRPHVEPRSVNMLREEVLLFINSRIEKMTTKQIKYVMDDEDAAIKEATAEELKFLNDLQSLVFNF